ncbi:MAG: RNA polymerase sigma-70 factor [Sphingobacteriaceae bacterium]|nr:RNA polymerase sigma-70 factor [Sphingobacteriaceae bacterium]
MQHCDLNDEELIMLLKGGDHKAFTAIYNRYWEKLFALAAYKLDDLDDSREVVQNIFVALWEKRMQLTITGSLNIYLAVSVKYGVIKSLAKQHNQQKYIDSLITKSLVDDSTQEWMEFSELKEQLEKLVTELPEKCRLVFRLSKEEGFSQKQIAEKLDISEKTVEAHMGKALKKIRSGLRGFLLTLL